MKTTIGRIVVFGLLTAAIVVAPTQTLAQEKKDKPAAEKKAASGQRGIPFHGKVTALDKTAKTVTVGARVFHVTPSTKIVKNGKPATLDDGAVGEQIGGSYTKGDDGKLTAKSIRFGPKPEGKAKAKGKSAAGAATKTE